MSNTPKTPTSPTGGNNNYITNNYVIPTCIIGAVFLVVLSLIGCFLYRVNSWSYGIIVLLFMAFVLGLATLISLIATFREMGRKQARESSDEINKIKESVRDLETKLMDMQKNGTNC